jgi:tetratricopeptide (TPR) repeat protein
VRRRRLRTDPANPTRGLLSPNCRQAQDSDISVPFITCAADGSLVGVLFGDWKLRGDLASFGTSAMNGQQRQHLGEIILDLRNLTGMTQKELAESSGLSTRSISDLERGRISRPRHRSLELLATALSLDRAQTKTLIAIARGAPVIWPETAASLAPGPPAALTHVTGRRAEVQEPMHMLGSGGSGMTGIPVISASSRSPAEPGGYPACLEAAELDVDRARSLLAAAQAAVSNCDWEQASAQATAALQLWRGEPIAGTDSDMLGPQIRHLTEMRLQLLETRANAELQLGRPEDVINELWQLTAAHPLRERLHAQLMLALYRSGRAAEALAAYQDARRVIVEGLGIEPGAELRGLHERILTGDPRLLDLPRPGQAPGAARDVAVVPRMLPAAPRIFVGRRTESDRVTAVVRSAQGESAGTVAIWAVDGMAGVGKTALALQIAHRLAESFPDGQMFLDLHGYTRDTTRREAGDALAALLQALAVPPQRIPADSSARAALYRQQLAGTRTLIVLDNAADEAQVRPLLPGTGGCLVLITSRKHLRALDEAHTVSLDVLPTAESVALFQQIAGPDRVADPALAEQAATLCAGLPVALRIAAALLRHRSSWSLEYLVGRLSSASPGLAPFADGERELAAIFDLSLAALPEEHGVLYRRLALIPGADTDAYAAAALLGTDPPRAERLLEDLLDHNLLIQQLPGRYRWHDLIRAHARALAQDEPAADRDAALDRLFDYYQHTAGRADVAIARFPRAAPEGAAPDHAPALAEPEEAKTWLRAERANLLAALHHAATHAQQQRSVALTSGLATTLLIDGPWAQAITLHSAAAAAAQQTGDRHREAAALIEVGRVQGLTGDWAGDASKQEKARDLYRDLGDQLGLAGALTQLGTARRMLGDCVEAERNLDTARDLYRDLGNQLGQASALTQLGDARRALGDFSGALRDLETALELWRDLGNRPGQGDTLDRLGMVRLTKGDVAGALLDLASALELWRDLGERAGQANTLTRLGDLHVSTGDFPNALRDLDTALKLYRDLGERSGQAIVLTLLGGARRSTGDLPGALRDLRSALDLHRQTGARGNEAWALNHYAAAVDATGDHAQALACYRDALRLARDTTQPGNEALALEGIGTCLLASGDTAAGATHLRQALDIFIRNDRGPDVARILGRLDRLND